MRRSTSGEPRCGGDDGGVRDPYSRKHGGQVSSLPVVTVTLPVVLDRGRGRAAGGIGGGPWLTSTGTSFICDGVSQQAQLRGGRPPHTGEASDMGVMGVMGIGDTPSSPCQGELGELSSHMRGVVPVAVVPVTDRGVVHPSFGGEVVGREIGSELIPSCARYRSPGPPEPSESRRAVREVSLLGCSGVPVRGLESLTPAEVTGRPRTPGGERAGRKTQRRSPGAGCAAGSPGGLLHQSSAVTASKGATLRRCSD